MSLFTPSNLRHSFFFRRIMLLLISALLLWTILTSLLYYFIARPVFISLKQKDLQPQATWIADNCSHVSSSNELDMDETVRSLVGISYNFYGVWTFIVPEGQPLIHTELPDSLSKSSQKNVLNDVITIYQELKKDSKNISLTRSPADFPGDILYVASPILFEQQFLGCVIIAQPLAELSLGFASLNVALLASGFLIALLLIIPAALAASHMVRPLQRIRLVAQAITLGDFAQCAVDHEENEISDLARAINHMAVRLSSTFNQLTVERNQLQLIIDSIAEGILAIDQNCQIKQSNDNFWQLCQQRQRSGFLHDLRGVDEIVAAYRCCLNRGQHMEAQIKIGDRQISCQLDPLQNSASTEILGVVGLFRDVTESQRLEQTRRDYVANVSHELRTPITAMRALLEPLCDKMVNTEADRQRYYGILLRETLRLSRLIDDMLTLSRLQAGRDAISQQALDLSPLLLALAERFELQCQEHDIHFTYKTEPDALPLVWSNADRIEQILFIFFDNALKFTPAEGQIQLVCERQERKIRLAICDSGKGIDPADLPYVFDRFYKADKAHNQKGTGLGLSIAQELAKQLQLDLDVSSHLGQGSCFSIQLRLASDVLRDVRHFKDVYDVDEDIPQHSGACSCD